MNKNSKRNLDATSEYPIKKIFYSKNSITVDRTTIQQFGSPTTKRSRFIQEWLTMPLLTTSEKTLNLPDKRTGKGSANPYLVLNCQFKKATKTSNPQIFLEIIEKRPRNSTKKTTGEKNIFSASYDIIKNKQTISAAGDLLLHLDKKSYELNGKNLFDEYVSSGIITKDGKLKSTVFKEIAQKFFDFVKNSPIDPDHNNQTTCMFRIFILPNDKKISFKQTINTGSKFKDSFGNNVSSIASNPSKNAKFMSFDDEAFTPNGMKKEKFYENIGVGLETLDKITLPQDKIFSRSGLNWIFIDMASPDSDFENILSGGIYHQLFDNYSKLQSRSGQMYTKLSMLKVLCIKMDTTKTKMEILLDENLTMEKLRELFSNMSKNEIPFSGIEVLIETTNNKILWENYLRFISAFLRGYGFDDSFLISIFTKLIRKQIFDWIKSKTAKDSQDFFKKSEFCRKILSISKQNTITLDDDENYAYGIGKIAGRYVKFRESLDDAPHSVKDILIYSKYDKRSLQHVFKRVSQGINFSKADDANLSKIRNYVSATLPKNEINDENQSNDYSYFFYKGMTETISEIQK